MKHHVERQSVNWDRIEGSWKLFKGSAKVQWGKLTEGRLDVVAGKREQHAGSVQEAHGIDAEAAQERVDRGQARHGDQEHRRRAP